MGREEMLRKYDSIVAFSELAAFIDMPVKHYSSGMFARLAFAVSIHLDPEVLLVDEVLAVGDQAFQRKCLDRIAVLRSAGITICMVSHASEAVRSLCSRALWFDRGRLVADGGAESVILQYLTRDTEQEAERLAAASPDGSAADAPSGPRWGNQVISIRRVRMLDEAGRDQHIFETGRSFVLQIEYHARQPVENPVFGMAIHRQDGLLITGPNTGFAGLSLPRVQGEGRVTYRVDALPLLDGLYHVSVAVVNRDDTQTFDFHDRLYPFRVVNLTSPVRERYGLVTMGGRWHAEHAVSELAEERPPDPSVLASSG
jgi:lipopolysaccharide transport system ATP-binding protein